MRLRIRLAVALAALGCFALIGAPTALAAKCPSTRSPAAAQSEPQFEQSLLCLINARRDKAGRRALRPNMKLRTAALAHSSDMVQTGYFEHTSPTGVDFLSRIVQAGYTQGARSWSVGENLVWGSNTESTPAALVSKWMNSRPHRANLMSRRFRQIGVGVVRGTPVNASDTGGITVASEFGFRRG